MPQRQNSDIISRKGRKLLAEEGQLEAHWLSTISHLIAAQREILLPSKPKRHAGSCLTEQQFEASKGPVVEAAKQVGDRLVASVRQFFPASYSTLDPNIESAIEKSRKANALWVFSPLEGLREYVDGLSQLATSQAAFLRRDKSGSFIPVFGVISSLGGERVIFNHRNGDLHFKPPGTTSPDFPTHEKIGFWYSRRMIDFERDPEGDEGFDRVLCNLGKSWHRDAFRRPCGGPGSAFLDLLSGEVELVVHNRSDSNQWDLAAGAALIKASGGWLCALDGTPFSCFNRSDPTNSCGFVASITLTQSKVLGHLIENREVLGF